MNYSNSRFRIMFLGLAMLAQSLSAHSPSIDLIEWVSTHNNPSKEVPSAVIAKNKKTKKSQKKMSAINKNVFYGIAGLAILALAIYYYKYTLGLSLVQKPYDKQKNAAIASENLPINIPILAVLPTESVVEQQLHPIEENKNQVTNVGFPDQASAAPSDDIMPMQPIQQPDDITQVAREELAPQDPVHIHESIASPTVNSSLLTPDSTIKNNEPKVNLPTVEKVIEKFTSAIIQQEPVPVSVVDNKHETQEKKTQELENPVLEQQASDNNPSPVIESSENPVVAVVQDFPNSSEDIEKTLRDEASLAMKRIAELKWQDETTYEDWQEIIRLQKRLAELEKRKAQ